MDTAALKPVELAALAGVSRVWVVRMLAGDYETIGSSTAQAVAKVFGCTLDWLLQGVGRAPDESRTLKSVAAAKRAHATIVTPGVTSVNALAVEKETA